MHHLTSRRRAFSLIELAVVLIVIAVIAAIAIPTFQATIAASDESAAEAEVATGLRNAVAIARARGEFGAPSPQVVAEAFAELSAHAPGVSAVTVGSWTVCDVDAVGYNDCVDNATGTLIRYQVVSGVVGLVVEGTYTVLARASGTEVVSWVDADGTPQNALDGPGGPTPTAYTATTQEQQLFSGEDVTFTVTSADGLAPIVVQSLDGTGTPETKAAMCDNLSRQVVSGGGALANCPGDDPSGENADNEDVNETDAPPAFACFSVPCTFRVARPGGTVGAFAIILPFEGYAPSYSGTWVPSS